MTPPRLLSGPMPLYTDEALAHEVQGTMYLRCRITLGGCAVGCRVLQGLPYMDAVTLDALRRRRYAPATLDGTPVEVYFDFKVTIRLPVAVP